jgi:hypothetical protein
MADKTTQYITQRDIKKIHKICDIKTKAKEVNTNKERKEKGIFTIRYEKEEVQNLEQDLELLKKYKSDDTLKTQRCNQAQITF